MKKIILLLAIFVLSLSSCLFFAKPSGNPPRTFMRSLAKKDGLWTIRELELQAYIGDPSLTGEFPAVDSVYINPGKFLFDDYDGDIDGTGKITLSNGSVVNFTFKVPDFEEAQKSAPEISFYFSGYPNLVCTAGNYEEEDSYFIWGELVGPVNYFPFIADPWGADYLKINFSMTITRDN